MKLLIEILKFIEANILTCIEDEENYFLFHIAKEVEVLKRFLVKINRRY